jgi:DNA invertase Pin-like site-specific DNA recombinase
VGERRQERPRRVGEAHARLAPGDVLIVTRLDRLARSTRDLLNVLAAVTERGAASGACTTPGRTRPPRMGG